MQHSNRAGVSLQVFGQEPFRIFFPAAVLAGIIGVLLWPLHFWGFVPFYPGPAHIRLMACGFFGGFIFGFLGTALPRMLSAAPLGIRNVAFLFAIYVFMVTTFVLGKVLPGDIALLVLIAFFVAMIVPRASNRKDIPPPGFVLVALAWFCIAAGTIISIMQDRSEPNVYLVNLERLLRGQGFVLLPILGIGPFLLPRFFGLSTPHDFPEGTHLPPSWTRKALLALGTGLIIIFSFLLEANGYMRLGPAIRFIVTLAYLGMEFPFRRAPKFSNALGACLRLAFIAVLTGFFAVTLFPVYRTSLLHLTLIGGFAVITFVVATRVVFGHSGNLERLQRGNRWLVIAVGIMLFAMATRVSGDFWPRIMASHYTYGAILWSAAALFWAIKVLPNVLVVEEE